MKTNHIILFLLFFALAVGVFSCSKKDTVKPVIKIEEPASGQTITLSQDSIHIHVETSDDIGLHEVKVSIMQGTLTGTVLYTTTKDVDSLNYLIHDHFMPKNITGLTPMAMQINANDHAGNETVASVNFYVKP